VDLDQLTQKVFAFMNESFDIKLSRHDEFNYMNSPIENEKNRIKINELLSQFVGICIYF
jgi:hypothetical protein